MVAEYLHGLRAHFAVGIGEERAERSECGGVFCGDLPKTPNGVAAGESGSATALGRFRAIATGDGQVPWLRRGDGSERGNARAPALG